MCHREHLLLGGEKGAVRCPRSHTVLRVPSMESLTQDLAPFRSVARAAGKSDWAGPFPRFYICGFINFPVLQIEQSSNTVLRISRR